MSDDDLKQMAAAAAVREVRDGMVVGLGTGSTAAHAILRLGRRVADDGLRIRGIATSIESETLAGKCGLALTTFDETTHIDLTIDGADEVDRHLNLIKGGGGALLREKVVASCSRELVIVIDGGKLVAKLGLSFPLPVEVVPFAWRPVSAELARLGGEPRLRGGEHAPFTTDNGNLIVDWHVPDGIDHPHELQATLNQIPGVVECGLFVGLADRVIVGRDGGLETLRRS